MDTAMRAFGALFGGVWAGYALNDLKDGVNPEGSAPAVLAGLVIFAVSWWRGSGRRTSARDRAAESDLP